MLYDNNPNGPLDYIDDLIIRNNCSNMLVVLNVLSQFPIYQNETLQLPLSILTLAHVVSNVTIDPYSSYFHPFLPYSFIGYIIPSLDSMGSS